jgi:Putative DNA-binding domain
VPFPIDVSKPFRYPSELKRLAQAVRTAGDYDETRWIEWKRTLDLTGAVGIRHIVRQILGFANRDPQVAAQWAGGHAYLVIGASPEALGGVTQLDHEQLVSKIRPYVGSQVTWTPEYIEIDGVIVLVIVVEPPRPGDEIHVVRKDLDRYKAGTVLIRRHGQADQADADEMAMLQRRLLARTPQVELAVESVVPAIENLPDFQGLIETWASEERVRRVAARYQPEPTDRGESAVTGKPLLGAAFAAAVAASRDGRNLERYMNEVDSYLAKAKQALMERGIWSLARHRPAMLAMQMLNSSSRNYAQVGVVLTIKSAGVRGGAVARRCENREIPTYSPHARRCHRCPEGAQSEAGRGQVASRCSLAGSRSSVSVGCRHPARCVSCPACLPEDLRNGRDWRELESAGVAAYLRLDHERAGRAGRGDRQAGRTQRHGHNRVCLQT